jgi:hypothetical protein
MKKAEPGKVSETQTEYDFRGGARGKYAKRLTQGANVVVLDDDVARVFRTSREVNDALRVLMRITQRKRGSGS